MVNVSTVTEFLLEGFAEAWELRLLLSTLLLLMYLATLLGNLIIITVTTLDQNLHTPMYFFLRNLSIVDMGYISVTVPSACVNSLTDNRAISVVGCATQIYLFLCCVSMELLFLTVMAWDRYVAICQPLQYPVIINLQFCKGITLLCLLGGFLYAALHTGSTFRLSFCQSIVIHQFFCDIPSLLRISCSDIFSNNLLNILSVIGFGGSCSVFIAMSYVQIFSTILKFPLKEERGKAFSTCVPHIAVVSVFLIFACYMYLKPPANSEMIQDMIFSVLYTIVPPFLNPIVYGLRNKEMKEAVRKVILRKFHSGKL
ncbi:olfactory receptor 14C36-like [Thomomys bottae]